ncbi:MAG TPA: hypothetical protein VGI96_42235, partial [Streptosporangiaceae bacterium]
MHKAAAVAVDHARPDDPAAGPQHALLDGGPADRDRVRVGRAVLVLEAGAEDGGAGGIEQRAAGGEQRLRPGPVGAVAERGTGVDDPVVAGRGGRQGVRLGQVA